MHLNHLSLSNFRNYARLELDLPARLTVLRGPNAQGKTNLLEAIHLLATGRSPRANAERELINWLAIESQAPYARLAAEIGEGSAAEKLELVLELAPQGGARGANGATVRKQVRINGAPKRALDLIGKLRVVLFLPEDVGLVAGAPAARRRYLDIALCQIDPVYCRALAGYGKALLQRNALLRRLRDEGGDAAQLTFWDEQMARDGAVLLCRRATAIAALDRLASLRHRELTDGAERLRLAHLPSPAAAAGYAEAPHDRIAEGLLAQLAGTRPRDIGAGASLLGPHRDDLAFSVEGRDLRAFGSRGQQRTATLALKLAEVEMMREVAGESPLLLLDDVMSELDDVRRHALLETLSGAEQVLATTTDWGDFADDLLAQASRLQVSAGRIAPA